MNGCINGKSNLTQNRLGFVERQNMGLHGLEKILGSWHHKPRSAFTLNKERLSRLL
jgi:hypothetical protein